MPQIGVATAATSAKMVIIQLMLAPAEGKVGAIFGTATAIIVYCSGAISANSTATITMDQMRSGEALSSRPVSVSAGGGVGSTSAAMDPPH